MKDTYETIYSVLTIAGFDSSGGAGIQGDIKTIASRGCYATSVLTSLPVQNMYGVKEIFEIPHRVVEEQLKVVFEDVIPHAVKIGMVHNPELVRVIAKHLKDYQIPIVFDPVMIASSGDSLIQEETIAAFKELLFPLVTLITPNLDETSVLVDEQIDTVSKMKVAGPKIMDMNVQAVLVKGGHLKDKDITSLLFYRQGDELKMETYIDPRFDVMYTHGAGCTLSSAIASYLALENDLQTSVKKALSFVSKAIFYGKNIRMGAGEKHELMDHIHENECLVKKNNL